MKLKTKIVPLCIGVLSFSILLCAAIYAWTEPGAAPTGGNINAPINTGSVAQTKAGWLTIGDANWAQLQFYQSVNDVYNPVTGASDRAHFHFGFPNTPSGKEPLIESPSDIWVIGSNHNVTADGYVKGGTGVCIGSDCRTAWPSSGSNVDQNCPVNQSVTGIKANGTIICGTGSLFNPSSFPCSTGVLPNSGSIKNKRMFVTSGTYSATDFTTGGFGYNSTWSMTTSDEAKADAKCQALANAAGFTGGTFKALVYMGNRDISNVVPTGSVFWSCGSSAGWKQVAQGMSDFFTNKGGNYLSNQIYNELGNSSGSTVWTGFEANNGGYNLLSKFNAGLYNIPAATGVGGYEIGWWGGCINGRIVQVNCGWRCELSAVAWYGFANGVSSAWAHAGTFNQYKDLDNQFVIWNNCASSTQRAL